MRNTPWTKIREKLLPTADYEITTPVPLYKASSHCVNPEQRRRLLVLIHKTQKFKTQTNLAYIGQSR